MYSHTALLGSNTVAKLEGLRQSLPLTRCYAVLHYANDTFWCKLLYPRLA